jgi:hypothetical protein
MEMTGGMTMDWLMGNSFFILLLLICVGMHIFGHGHSHDHANHKSEREHSPDDFIHDSHRRKL